MIVNLNLDVLGGVLVFVIAMGVFALYSLTGPRHDDFPEAPGYVRLGIVLFGIMLLWRADDLLQLSDGPAGPGHMDAKAMMATFVLVYLVAVLIWWAASSKMAPLSWVRLRHAFREARADPAMAPMVKTGHEVAEELRAGGLPTVEAREGPDAVWREGAPKPARAVAKHH